MSVSVHGRIVEDHGIIMEDSERFDMDFCCSGVYLQQTVTSKEYHTLLLIPIQLIDHALTRTACILLTRF